MKRFLAFLAIVLFALPLMAQKSKVVAQTPNYKGLQKSIDSLWTVLPDDYRGWASKNSWYSNVNHMNDLMDSYDYQAETYGVSDTDKVLKKIFDENNIIIAGEDHSRPVAFEKFVSYIIKYNKEADKVNNNAFAKSMGIKRDKVAYVTLENYKDWWTKHYNQYNSIVYVNPSDPSKPLTCAQIGKKYYENGGSAYFSIHMYNICRLLRNGITVLPADAPSQVKTCPVCKGINTYLKDTNISSKSYDGMDKRNMYSARIVQGLDLTKGKVVMQVGAGHLHMTDNTLGLAVIIKNIVPNSSVVSIAIAGGMKYKDSEDKVTSGCGCDDKDVDQSFILMLVNSNFANREGTYILPINDTDKKGVDINYVLSYDKKLTSSLDIGRYYNNEKGEYIQAE